MRTNNGDSNVQIRKVLAAVVAVVTLLAGVPAAAQQTDARILGRVTDQTGDVLPGVTVTLTSEATGAVRTAASDDQGRYTLTNLAPGTYQVKLELSGGVCRIHGSSGVPVPLLVGPSVMVASSAVVGRIRASAATLARAPSARRAGLWT